MNIGEGLDLLNLGLDVGNMGLIGRENIDKLGRGEAMWGRGRSIDLEGRAGGRGKRRKTQGRR